MMDQDKSLGENKPDERQGVVRSRSWIRWFPFVVAAGVLVGFYLQLDKDNKTINSPLVGKTLPAFTATPIPGAPANMKAQNGFTSALSENEVSILNIWASWCVPCRAEHPVLSAMAVMDQVPVYGLNYKDKPEAALGFLEELGNPFTAIGADTRGTIGIDLGLYGVPETYIIKPGGEIAFKLVGPLTPERLEQEFRPELDKARAQVHQQ